jgi:DNA-binding GntR family transcriptional regulator
MSKAPVRAALIELREKGLVTAEQRTAGDISIVEKSRLF